MNNSGVLSVFTFKQTNECGRLIANLICSELYGFAKCVMESVCGCYLWVSLPLPPPINPCLSAAAVHPGTRQIVRPLPCLQQDAVNHWFLP